LTDTGWAFREDRGDGLDLRALAYRGEPVAARVYFALRDEWWRTVPLRTVARSRVDTAGGFAVSAEAESGWASHPLSVRLRYEAVGDELVASFEAEAGGPFRYGRIGFCVLFGESYAGRPAVSWRAGVPTRFTFPGEVVTRDQTDLASLRFHRPFVAVQTTLGSGAPVRYGFEGEEFEFEDQRNWTDASFKAYSAPRLGRREPSSTVAGARFAQRVRIQVEPQAPAAGPGRTAGPAAGPSAIVLGDVVGAMPAVGLFEGRVSARSYRPAAGFYQLNADRPDPAELSTCDSIELGVNGAVHADDEDSVLETTAVHGALVAQTRAAYPGLPVLLAPVSFLDVAGDWRDETGHYLPEPPLAEVPARWSGEHAATWVIASACRAVPAGVAQLRYLDARLPAGAPAARAVARLGALAGGEVLSACAPEPLAALAVRTGAGVTLAVANPGPDTVHFGLPGGAAAELAGFASAWYELSG
jgi:hypothetical protein